MNWNRKILSFLKRNDFFKKIIHSIKNLFLYYYVIIARFNPKSIQRICFFYLPEVPDFGQDFIYMKLGKKEPISNPNNYSIIFEADLPKNLSALNKHFMDYSGLYALYENNLITKDYLFLIHYDTQIRHPRWKDIIESQVVENTVVYSTWDIDRENSEVAKWVYDRIDEVFLLTYKRTFLSYLKENNISTLPNSSQFCCSRETFLRLMEFLRPIYEYILNENVMTFKNAHLLERAWGLFFAIEGYTKVDVIFDSHSQNSTDPQSVIGFPLLSTAIEKNVDSFSELL